MVHMADALSAYNASARAASSAPPSATFRDSEASASAFRIKARATVPQICFLGIFDTVAGIDLADLSNVIIRVPGNVVSVAHALALDETRSVMLPLIITPAEDAVWDAPTAPTRYANQVFFAGAHSDVGGGFLLQGEVHIRMSRSIPGDAHDPESGAPQVDRERALSEVTLQWMLAEAVAHGCQGVFAPACFRPEADIAALLAGTMLPLDPDDPDSHDLSRQPLYRIGRYFGLRSANVSIVRELDLMETSVHSSVLTLIAQPPEQNGYVYRPANPHSFAATLVALTGVVAPSSTSGAASKAANGPMSAALQRPFPATLRLWRRESAASPLVFPASSVYVSRIPPVPGINSAPRAHAAASSGILRRLVAANPAVVALHLPTQPEPKKRRTWCCKLRLPVFWRTRAVVSHWQPSDGHTTSGSSPAQQPPHQAEPHVARTASGSVIAASPVDSSVHV
jgi:hypothetical protein